MSATDKANTAGLEVSWVPDARNPNDRRLYVDGSQWAKIYGWDKPSLDARCAQIEAALVTAASAEARIAELERWQAAAIRSARIHDENIREFNARAQAAEARADRLADSNEGLTEDLYQAVLVAYRRGAHEWARLNYPQWIEAISAGLEVAPALQQEG